jgi:hypothetical protein
MDLVGSVSVPNYKLAVLRCGDEVSSVGGPVHSIDFGQMTLQITPGLHAYTWECFCVVLCNLPHWVE